MSFAQPAQQGSPFFAVPPEEQEFDALVLLSLRYLLNGKICKCRVMRVISRNILN